MIKYVTYNSIDGSIIQWGYGEPVVGESYVEHNFDATLYDHKVNLGTLAVEACPAMSLTPPGGTTPADGVSEAVITGIPTGTRAYITIDGETTHVQVTDGSLEISVATPQIVYVVLRHRLWATATLEVEFV